MATQGEIKAHVQELLKSNKVVVFSKTYCPFCTRLKGLLGQLKADYKLLELDTEADGAAIQDELLSISGIRTVPNMFVGGKSLGGCDEVHQLHRQGKLVPLL